MNVWQHLTRGIRDRSGKKGRTTPPARPTFRPTLEALEGRLLLSAPGSGSIASNFNGTPIPAGDTLWFSSAFKVNGLGSSPVTLHFTNDTISFTANGVNNVINAPNADVTLSPTAMTATTTFNAAANAWETTLPMRFSGNAFLDGVAFPLSSPLPGGIKNVTWQGQFTSDTPGVSVNWQWSAAAYTQFSTDYNALGIKSVDDNHVSAYQYSDHAGTPEAFLPYVVGGATGGGGSNYTGSLSSTQQATPTPTTLGGVSGVVATTAGTSVAGVVVALTTTNSLGQTVTVYATTGSNGSYSFTGLQAGTYTLSVSPPYGYQNNSDQVGTVNGASNGTALSPGTIGNINLEAGDTGLNYDFTEQPPFVVG
jgi:hypothetical protein